MLTITRRPGEGLMVGEALIRVVDGSNGRLRLQIEAPRHVPISREEMLVPAADGGLYHPDFILSRLA